MRPIHASMYLDSTVIRWRLFQTRPADRVREGFVLWERRGEINFNMTDLDSVGAVLALVLADIGAKLPSVGDGDDS